VSDSIEVSENVDGYEDRGTRLPVRVCEGRVLCGLGRKASCYPLQLSGFFAERGRGVEAGLPLPLMRCVDREEFIGLVMSLVVRTAVRTTESGSPGTLVRSPIARGGRPGGACALLSPFEGQLEGSAHRCRVLLVRDKI